MGKKRIWKITIAFRRDNRPSDVYYGCASTGMQAAIKMLDQYTTNPERLKDGEIWLDPYVHSAEYVGELDFDI